MAERTVAKDATVQIKKHYAYFAYTTSHGALKGKIQTKTVRFYNFAFKNNSGSIYYFSHGKI
ncbi:hypothetical protein GW846_02075 [Candidatus Gracilibacteria bacterium]|nr:hypothetical protein [Candidatus Gracilibacteria bacterium]